MADIMTGLSAIAVCTDGGYVLTFDGADVETFDLSSLLGVTGHATWSSYPADRVRRYAASWVPHIYTCTSQFKPGASARWVRGGG